jgi:hypothetical protein
MEKTQKLEELNITKTTKITFNFRYTLRNSNGKEIILEILIIKLIEREIKWLVK